MDNELISKRELLDLTGISYGQLYRWKRKNLIPEVWFIRKSTFTGQETFFPRDKILQRIDKIKDMKEDLSLDDIAEVFSPSMSNILLNKDDLIKCNIVSKTSLDLYTQLYGNKYTFPFDKILFMAVVDKFLETGGISLDEGKLISENLESDYKNFQGKDCDLVFIRKLGISTCFLISIPNEIYFERSAKIVERVNLSGLIEELTSKIVKGV